MLNRIKYLLKCIYFMDYKGLFQTVNTVHSICGKNKIYLFFDVVRCGLKYGAGYKDYLLCEFYLLTKEQRATYVTRGLNNTISLLMNDPDFYYIFRNKDMFYARYKDFVRREWLFLPKTSKEEFIVFMENKEQVIVKPSNESCGIGVEKLNKSSFKDLEDMYGYISSMPSRIVEEVIPQHELINKINPSSVNTLRIVTICSEGKAHIIYAFIRIGNGDRPVDNINAGGMCAPIDVDTGIISHVGYDKDRITYTHHPKTGCPIEGYQIPMWKDAVQMALDCAILTPEMGYAGWDVAITPTGPVIVEGNDFPGHDILQMPPHVPDRIGMLPTFKKYVKGL